MKKTKFLKILAKNINNSLIKTDEILKKIFNTIKDVMVRENNLTLMGFGKFKTFISKAKKIKIPKGDIIDVPEKRIIKFIASKDLKSKINTKK